jgi:hypothetical protein
MRLMDIFLLQVSEITLRICFLVLDIMAFWLARTGRYGEQEQAVFEYIVATLVWNELPDIFLNRRAHSLEVTDL